MLSFLWLLLLLPPSLLSQVTPSLLLLRYYYSYNFLLLFSSRLLLLSLLLCMLLCYVGFIMVFLIFFDLPFFIIGRYYTSILFVRIVCIIHLFSYSSTFI